MTWFHLIFSVSYDFGVDLFEVKRVTYSPDRVTKNSLIPSLFNLHLVQRQITSEFLKLFIYSNDSQS